MRRHTILSSLAALICMAMLAFTSAAETKSQCCFMQYDVHISALTPLCPSITVSASFDGAVTPHTFTANGSYLNLPYLSTSVCPTFDWVSLDGGATKIFPGQTGTLYSSNTCCFTVSAVVTNSPCKTTIKIGPPLSPC